MKEHYEYDQEKHVTAEELRRVGYNIPNDIPDVAWIPRGSLVPYLSTVSADSEDPTKVNFCVDVVFTEPFRWLSLKFKED